MARPEHKSYPQKLFTRWFEQSLEEITHKNKPSSSSVSRLTQYKTKMEFLLSATTMPHQGLLVPVITAVYVLMCYIWFILWHNVTLVLLCLMWAGSLQELFRFNRLINAHPSIHSLNHLSSPGSQGAGACRRQDIHWTVYHRANTVSATHPYSWGDGHFTSLHWSVRGTRRIWRKPTHEAKLSCNLNKLPFRTCHMGNLRFHMKTHNFKCESDIFTCELKF